MEVEKHPAAVAVVVVVVVTGAVSVIINVVLVFPEPQILVILTSKRFSYLYHVGCRM